MALKVRDFASNGSSEDNVTRGVKEERRREDDDDVLSYAPPRRSRDARRSGERRSPEYSRVPRGHQDEKPYFGPRDPDGNIQVTEQT